MISNRIANIVLFWVHAVLLGYSGQWLILGETGEPGLHCSLIFLNAAFGLRALNRALREGGHD